MSSLRATLLAAIALFAWVTHDGSASAQTTRSCQPDFLTIDPHGE
jgi:hypothetical protein